VLTQIIKQINGNIRPDEKRIMLQLLSCFLTFFVVESDFVVAAMRFLFNLLTEEQSLDIL